MTAGLTDLMDRILDDVEEYDLSSGEVRTAWSIGLSAILEGRKQIEAPSAEEAEETVAPEVPPGEIEELRKERPPRPRPEMEELGELRSELELTQLRHRAALAHLRVFVYLSDKLLQGERGRAPPGEVPEPLRRLREQYDKARTEVQSVLD